MGKRIICVKRRGCCCCTVPMADSPESNKILFGEGDPTRLWRGAPPRSGRSGCCCISRGSIAVDVGGTLRIICSERKTRNLRFCFFFFPSKVIGRREEKRREEKNVASRPRTVSCAPILCNEQTREMSEQSLSPMMRRLYYSSSIPPSHVLAINSMLSSSPSPREWAAGAL